MLLPVEMGLSYPVTIHFLTCAVALLSRKTLIIKIKVSSPELYVFQSVLELKQVPGCPKLPNIIYREQIKVSVLKLCAFYYFL